MAIGMAGAIDPVNLSDKNISDMVDEDLTGASAGMMGIDESFLRDNPEDGLPPENMTNKPPMQYVGSSVGYQPQEQKFYTPDELEMLKNTSTWLEILP